MNLLKAASAVPLMLKLKTMPPLDANGTVDFAFAQPTIRVRQVPYEFRRFAEIVAKLKPKFAMEIGTLYGGTLFVITRLADSTATIVSVDMPGGKFGGGYSRLRVPLYRCFPTHQQKLHLVRADSHHSDTLLKVRQLLNGHALDLLFIDGDHSYEGVKADFEQYAPLVRKGGVIALHDIAENTTNKFKKDCKVSEFWREVRLRFQYEEIIENPFQGWAGIGVLTA
jgi:cephalosporin hydroxylase